MFFTRFLSGGSIQGGFYSKDSVRIEPQKIKDFPLFFLMKFLNEFCYIKRLLHDSMCRILKFFRKIATYILNLPPYLHVEIQWIIGIGVSARLYAHYKTHFRYLLNGMNFNDSHITAQNTNKDKYEHVNISNLSLRFMHYIDINDDRL